MPEKVYVLISSWGRSMQVIKVIEGIYPTKKIALDNLDYLNKNAKPKTYGDVYIRGFIDEIEFNKPVI